MKSKLIPALALTATLFLPASAQAVQISNAKVTGVTVANGSNAFGPYVQLSVVFDKSFGSSCPVGSQSAAIFRVYAVSGQLAFDTVALENFRQVAISARLSGRTVFAESDGCHDSMHLLKVLQII